MAVKEWNADAAGDSSQSTSERQQQQQCRDRNCYYLSKCLLKGSPVLQAAYGHIRSPSTFDVVFGKESSLELAIIGEDGIVQSICEQPVFGSIIDLAILPWNPKCRAIHSEVLYTTHGKDLLVVLSDSGKLSFLTFSIEMHRFLAVAHIDVSSPGNARKELGTKLAVEPMGHAVSVAALEDNIAVFPVTALAGNNIVEKHIEFSLEPDMPADKKRGLLTRWCTVWSLAFVSCQSQVTSNGKSVFILAALVNRKGAVENELDILLCDTDVRIMHLIKRFSPAGPLILDLFGVPSLPGYAILVRYGEFAAVDLRDPRNPVITCRRRLSYDEEGDEEGSFSVAASALLELRDSHSNALGSSETMCIDTPNVKDNFSLARICSWSWEPKTSGLPRFAFCLDSGEVFIGDILYGEQGMFRIVISDYHYKCSSCNTLLWTKGDYIAAFVEMGDGQVLKLSDGKLLSMSVIQNIAPILDIALVDYHNEKQDQLFACCGANSEGSIRIIRNGIRFEKLLSTAPLYQGVTGTWTMRMRRSDPDHSFLVISFVEETRVLSVGLNFVDITESSGFEQNACTLACGLFDDGLVAQVCRNEVRLCSPMLLNQLAALNISTFCSSWRPESTSISLGAVSWRTIILAMSSPGVLIMLGVRMLSSGSHELYAVQKVKLEAEVSCISIPQEEVSSSSALTSSFGLSEETSTCNFPTGVDIGKVFVVGTHKPSVELLSMVPGESFASLAVGYMSLSNTMGTAISGWIPQDVRLVLFDRFYILSGLRNGMLLRFEWPPKSTFATDFCFQNSCLDSLSMSLSSYDGCLTQDRESTVDMQEDTFAAELQLIAVRRVGITPVFLVPLGESLRSNIIALSDRPWLIQNARHRQGIAYTSISFRPSTHVTPVCTADCPNGILFVADCSLHLVEMVHTKRLNVQKFMLKGTPRRVLYHSESKTLLVMMQERARDVSKICCIDPLSGSLLSSFSLDAGESAKCMCLWKPGNEQYLVVGTGTSSGRPIMPSGEAASSKGRLLLFQLEQILSSCSGMVHSSSVSSSIRISGASFNDGLDYYPDNTESMSAPTTLDEVNVEGVTLDEGQGWQLTLKCLASIPGIVLSICPYLDQYLLAAAGNNLFCLGTLIEIPLRLKKCAHIRTRFTITSMTVHLTRIAVGDCRDGILFYTYQEDSKKLEQLYCDPAQRIVADCILMDEDTAVASDRQGNFCALSSINPLDENASPERNLTLSCWYHMGEIIMRMRKGSLSYKLPNDDGFQACTRSEIILDGADAAVVASTLLGGVLIFIQLSREDYELLEAVQARLASYPITAPVLGNDHSEFRGRGAPNNVCKVLDGDMLAQFLELTSMQQQAVLGSMEGTSCQKPLPAEHILRLLERVHNALN